VRARAEPPAEAPSSEPAPEGASAWARACASLCRGYLSFDRRTLGLVRLMLGALLLLDLARRAPYWLTLYSSEGLAPADVTLAAQLPYENVSLVFAFDHPVAARALFALCALTFGALFVGYRTKLAQIASVVVVTGLNGRLLLVENGGYVVENLLVTWTAFLPLGERFSIDALARSLERGRGETLEDLGTTARARDASPFVSLVGLGLVVQVWAIYFFNVVHKTGEGWREGTAVHSVVHVDRMVTPLVAALREHVPWPAYLLATKATLWLEGVASVLAWAPLYRDHARRLLVLVMCALHLAFGLTFALGPFAWSMIVLAFLFLPGAELDRAARALRSERRARTVWSTSARASGTSRLACSRGSTRSACSRSSDAPGSPRRSWWWARAGPRARTPRASRGWWPRCRSAPWCRGRSRCPGREARSTRACGRCSRATWPAPSASVRCRRAGRAGRRRPSLLPWARSSGGSA
jgi:hypothetical protein